MAINSIEDTLLLLRNHILSQAEITNLVSDRVLTDHFYDFDDATIQMPLIILDLQGGKANYGMGVQKLEIDIYCYSKSSSSECAAVYDAFYKNVHAARLANANLNPAGTIMETDRPDTGYNKEIRAWYSIGKYHIYTAG